MIAFYPPEVVRVGWEAALETVPDIRASGLRYAQACHEWGRARLGRGGRRSAGWRTSR